MGSATQAARGALEALKQQGRYRVMRTIAGQAGPRVSVNGREALLFAGSNYLDLAAHPEVTAAAAAAAEEFGCAVGGSRLINGNSELHEAFESELADFIGTESALVMGPGFAANVGLIPLLADEGDWILSDELCHASMIDGCRLSRAHVDVFAHGDSAGLESKLRRGRARYRNALLLVDGLYSMDGDIANLSALAALANDYDAILFVDDTHGFGTLGTEGRGAAALAAAPVPLYVGSLSKSLGSYGSFLASGYDVRDWVVNACRSFVFSCALPPPQVAAARTALAILRREPERVERLRENAHRLRALLRERQLEPMGDEDSPIVPVLIGADDATMAASDALIDRGYFVQGIRYPSVAPGSARLRLTVICSHTDAELVGLADALAEILRAA